MIYEQARMASRRCEALKSGFMAVKCDCLLCNQSKPWPSPQQMQLKCERCGSQEFEARWQGLTYEFRCARCHWGCCTTRLPPILEDKGPYTIIITSLGSDPTRALIALNRRFSHGIRRTREIFSAGEYPLFTSDAYKVWGEAQKLLQEQVPFRIEPEYPYDLSSYVPEHAHEHDWTPIGSCEG